MAMLSNNLFIVLAMLTNPRLHQLISNKTRCTRGDARSFFCTSKTYLYAQNEISYEYIQYCFKNYIKLHAIAAIHYPN